MITGRANDPILDHMGNVRLAHGIHVQRGHRVGNHETIHAVVGAFYSPSPAAMLTESVMRNYGTKSSREISKTAIP